MTQPSTGTTQEALAQRFLAFATREGDPNGSPLYARLCRGIAADSALLTLAEAAQSGQPAPNLLLAAVHYLLLGDQTDPLAAFYSSLTRVPDQTHDPYPVFRTFCLAHAEEIRALVATRRVQTNEIGRCACLLPAFGLVAEQARGRPLALVELGASAGLNLLWDRYGYDYGDGRRLGPPRSPVQLTCALRGARVPPFPRALPGVVSRVGADLAPIDVSDADARLWLRALVWPEHRERAQRLERALDLARRDPPPLMAGDALALLPDLLAAIPAGAIPCFFHSFTLNQFPPQARERLSTMLAEASASRAIYRIALEDRIATWEPRLELITYAGGARSEQVLARCAAHGWWMEWLA